MNSTIPIAVIGVGEHGKNHARALKQVEGAELVGVFDIAPERARDAARDLGVPAFESLDEALTAARAVSVVIPTSRHAELANRAFDRGVDVLLRDAAVIEECPIVNVHAFLYEAGRHKLELIGKGSFVVLGVVPQWIQLEKRDAGLRPGS